MRSIAPVDKKRQHATHARRKGICKSPGELSSIGLPPVSHSYRSEVDQFTSRRFRKVFEITSLDGPSDETRPIPLVDAEYFYLIATQDVRIRSDDFQVTVLAEADQRVPGAVDRMAAAGYRFYPETILYKANAKLQVGRCKHEVVDACGQ